MNEAIKLAIEKGGYKNYLFHDFYKGLKVLEWSDNQKHEGHFRISTSRGVVTFLCGYQVSLDPEFWVALGNALGWKYSQYQMVELKKPFYSSKNDVIGAKGVIVGKGRNKPPDEIYYVKWDGFKSRSAYPKENLKIYPKTHNWKMAANQYFDLVLTGGDTESFWKELMAAHSRPPETSH